MYEMEGPRSIAQPSTPIAQLPVARLLSAADRTTSTDTRREFRLPGLSLRSGVSPNTFNLRSTRAGSGYGQGQHDQGERPAGFLALGWIGGLGRIAAAPFGVAGVFPPRPFSLGDAGAARHPAPFD